MQTFLGHLRDNMRGYVPTHPKKMVEGWMYPDVNHIWTMVNPKKDMLFIEVGSWKGLSSTTFAKRMKNAGLTGCTVLCIDTWLGAPEFWTWGLKDPTRGGSLKPKHGFPMVYYEFLSNVFHENLQDIIVPFPISSIQGASVLSVYDCQADAIYIDASHEQGDVYRDMCAYWELLSPGGVMFGDDYDVNWPGVIHDVELFCKTNKLTKTVKNVTWFIKKPI